MDQGSGSSRDWGTVMHTQSTFTHEMANELIYERECSLITIEHLDVYHVLHWTPDIFFAQKSGNILCRSAIQCKLKSEFDGENIPFIIILERGLNHGMINGSDWEGGERIVVSFRRRIGDIIGYAFVSLQRRKNPIPISKGEMFFVRSMEHDE